MSKKLSADECLPAYLALGPERSLRKLRQVLLKDEPTRTPADRTIKGWSADRNWQAAAAAHDLKVKEAVVQKVAAVQIRDGTNRLLRIHGFVDAAFARATELVGGQTDLSKIVLMAIEAEKQAQVMVGGVSNRTETISGADSVTAADILRRRLEDQYGLPPTSGEASGKPN